VTSVRQGGADIVLDRRPLVSHICRSNVAAQPGGDRVVATNAHSNHNHYSARRQSQSDMKKPRTMPGLPFQIMPRSVPCDDRTTPIEVIVDATLDGVDSRTKLDSSGSESPQISLAAIIRKHVFDLA
jgi:hypothetical protein